MKTGSAHGKGGKANKLKTYSIKDENGKILIWFRNKLAAREFVSKKQDIYGPLTIEYNPHGFD